MKTLAIGSMTAIAGFIFGKLHGKDHMWRRYGYARNYNPTAPRQL